jgi:hypothetical protein
VHRPGQAAEQQPGDEQHHTGGKRHDRPHPVAGPARDHDADQVAEEEGAEHPAVERDVAEVGLDLRHDGGDGEGLGRHQRHEQHQPDREHPAARSPHAARERVGGRDGGGHAGQAMAPAR